MISATVCGLENMYIYTCIHIHMYMYVHMYAEEGDRERQKGERNEQMNCGYTASLYYSFNCCVYFMLNWGNQRT